jgi:hypothetical protein
VLPDPACTQFIGDFIKASLGMVVDGNNGGGVNMLLPLADLQKQRDASPATNNP